MQKGERCHSAVAAWYASIGDDDLFLGTLVLGEIRKGIERLRSREPLRAATLEAWLDQVRTAFGERVLGVDAVVADHWGRMCATRSIPIIDGLLAATALAKGLVLVTRNVVDVEGLGATILNPFHARGAAGL